MVTLAPELDGAIEVIRSLAANGVAMSLGHSAATAQQARAGVDAGASSVTHLFNAMAPLHHRAPGLAGVALTDARLHVGLIADGVHVAPEMVAVANIALGDRLVLVTDSVAALGTGSDPQALGGARVSVDQGAVRLADGTLAGSVLSLDQAVRNLVAFTDCPLEVAVAAASTAPARLLRDATRGGLDPGARADAVVLDNDLRSVVTIVGGQIVHDAR